MVDFWKLLTTPPPKVEIPVLENFINNIDAGISQWIAKQLLSLTQLLSTFLLSTPTELLQSKAFHTVYLTTTAIAYAGILPAVGYIGIRALLGKMDADEVFKSLGRLILVPLGISLAPKMTILFLQIMNSLSLALIRATPGVKIDEALVPAGLEIGLLIFTAIYLVMLVKLLLFYCYRNYAFLVMVALFPLVLLTYATGHISKIQRWVKELVTLLITQVVHALQLVILVSMTVIVGRTTEPGVPSILLQIGALMFMLKTPDWLAEYMHDTPDPITAINKIRNTLDINRINRRLTDVKKWFK
jgi:hypothetical protein